MEKHELWNKIIAYKKVNDLFARMEIIRDGGISRAMMYKAFRPDVSTPLSSLVIETAKEMITEHETNIKNATAQMSAV